MISFPLGAPLRTLVREMAASAQLSFPVVDEAGRYRGLFASKDIRQFLFDPTAHDLTVAQDLAHPVEPLRMDADLSGVMRQFARVSFDELPVVASDGSGHVLGLLRRQDVIAAYNARVVAERGGKE